LANGEPKAKGKAKANGAPKEPQLADPSDVELEWPSLPSTRPAGLFNPSMACYSNATLQMLLHTPPLLNLVKDHDPRSCRCPLRAWLTAGELADRNAYCMTCSLRATALEHFSGKKKAYKPQAVQGNLGRR
jgi:ubiquitin carboxyl-terminal hydrolase 36/42